MMEVATNSLVTSVEVWRPDAGGERLVWCAGFGADDVAESRRHRQYQSGEGFVGRGWSLQSPLIERNHEGRLDEEFATQGISRAVAIPAMQGEHCRGVIVFLCDESDGKQGAFEVWRPNERSELALTESWHAGLDRFGLISQYVKFPKRAGLPGKVWDDRFPRVMGSLSRSRDFVRAAGAKAEGLSTAIGIPFMKSPFHLDAVLLLLSAVRTPIARVMEVWAAEPQSGAQSGATTGSLKIVSADYGPHVDLAPLSQRLRLKVGDGLAGRVFKDKAPWLTRDLLGVEFRRGKQFTEGDFEWGLGLPIFVGEELLAVVTLFN